MHAFKDSTFTKEREEEREGDRDEKKRERERKREKRKISSGVSGFGSRVSQEQK
ncbi:hypothetical protein [Mesotoga sp.]|uniref:hypothetical protein n=1 Tax=Mesotoga sp. TaxID=2053577 RepID=UPI00345E6892